MNNFTGHPGGRQHPVLHGAGLGHHPQDIAAGDAIPHLEPGLKRPGLLPVQGGDDGAPADKDAGGAPQGVQGPLDAVEDLAQQTRPDLHRQRRPLPHHRVAGPDAAGVLVDLEGGHLAVQGDDLADEPRRPHLHGLVHGQDVPAAGPHHRPAHPDDFGCGVSHGLCLGEGDQGPPDKAPAPLRKLPQTPSPNCRKA